MIQAEVAHHSAEGATWALSLLEGRFRPFARGGYFAQSLDVAPQRIVYV